MRKCNKSIELRKRKELQAWTKRLVKIGHQEIATTYIQLLIIKISFPVLIVKDNKKTLKTQMFQGL